MSHITRCDSAGHNLIKQFEGLSLRPYADSVGIPTIGYGMTYYPDTGRRVSLKDRPLTTFEANTYFSMMLLPYERAVDSMTVDTLTQNQFNALVSLCYNIGIKALQGSTLIKLVNGNPNSPAIKEQFLRWNRAGGKVLKGLTNRREKEVGLYFG